MEDLLSRAVEEIISPTEFKKLLQGKKPLRLKLGVDPSSPDIHLGHTVILRKLRKLQDMGHTVIFLIGDGTARIGDPSGRNKTRPVLSEPEILANSQTYLDQVGKILDVSKAEIRRNSEWLDKLDFSGLLRLAGQFTVAQIIEREDFKTRLGDGSDLSLHEILYPVMQAYDSVMLEADVEFGGTDQRFNMLAGRALQKKMGQPSQQVFMTKLLVGTDGVNKMSKSLGNYIGIAEPAVEMYGKIMSIPDELIAEYYELCTDVKLDVVHELVKTLAAGANPRDAKASLAREIVGLYYDPEVAEKAETEWSNQFVKKQLPEEITEFNFSRVKIDVPVSERLVDARLATSKSEARRLIQQGGVRLNGEVITEDAVLSYKDGDVLQVGKRNFVRLREK